MEVQPIVTWFSSQVKHSKTSSQSSYGRDFRQLIDIYNGSRKIAGKEKTTSFHELDNKSDNSASSSMSLASDTNPSYNIEDDELDEDEVDSGTKNVSHASREKEMSVEYLENDVDVFLSANDWDGTVSVILKDLLSMLAWL